MDAARSIDLLLAIRDSGERRSLTAVFKRLLKARVSGHETARSALTSAQTTSFDAAVCSPLLGDAQWHQFASILHSKNFGYSDMPVCVLCQPGEEERLQPLTDLQTFLIPYTDDNTVVHNIEEIVHRRVRPTLLIVEDEPNPALFAQTVLKKDFAVELATSAEDALLAWRSRRHDLILLDLMLPGMSGADLQRIILAEAPQQPIIILTGNPSVENHKDLVLGGATDFLAKPSTEHELRHACTAAIWSARTRHLAARASEQGERAHILSSRIRVASYSLRTGRTEQASQHLDRALRQCNSQPTDDEWTALLSEFPDSRRAK